MNKTAIKNFAIWARKKLIAEITYKAGLMGVTERGIKNPLPQSTKDVQFFDIGGKEPYSITGVEIEQRRNLIDIIQKKEKQSDYKTAYSSVIEEVAYTWFNRLIAVRFMEVNDYLPARIRVLSSESSSKIEPDLVTSPFDADLDYTPYEKDRIIQLKNENKLDELFRMLFIKQCNALNAILPELFQKTNDYTELLMNVSFTDKDGVVYRLVHDIPEDDFNVEKEGQVEIIGWLYQYYNTELNELVYDGSLSRSAIPKELLPAATTIYTPDWAIRYMLENSLGRLWLEHHPDSNLKSKWRYYLDDVDQESEVLTQSDYIRGEYIKPETIKIIDPCMGSGHILVYAFDVLMQIYESCGYSQREAAKSIVENNLFGLDIDNRAYQLSYFALMMKARQYNRRILDGKTKFHVYAVQESNEINRSHLQFFGSRMGKQERSIALNQLEYLLDVMKDAKEYGSILDVNNNLNWGSMVQFINDVDYYGQMTFDSIELEVTQKQLFLLVEIAAVMSQKYDVVVTNPPYLGSSRFSSKLSDFVSTKYPDVKSDLSMVMFKRTITGLSKANGFVSFITTTSWMFLKSFEKLREYILQNTNFESLVDFGTELFDGKVGHNPIVAWVSRMHKTGNKMTAVRLVDFCYSRREEKEPEFFNASNRYFPRQENFTKIPGVPIAYWASDKFLSNFSKGVSIDEISDFTGSQHKTADNERFLRYWWEIGSGDIGRNRKWQFYIKGGEFRRWYGNIDLVIDWSDQAISFYKQNPTSNLLAEKYRYKEGITYTSLSSAANGFRYLPPIAIFDIKGPSIVNVKHLYYVLGLLNTKIATLYLKTFNSTITLQVKDVKAFPLIIDHSIMDSVERKVIDNVRISKNEWDSYENSWEFVKHPFLSGANNIADAFEQRKQLIENEFNQLKVNEEELNRIFIDLYGLQGELTPEIEDKDLTIRKAALDRDVRSFISYVVGCMFGRYSLDIDGLAYAGGEWEDSKYSTFIPDKDNVIPITDEEYFEDDIVGLFCAFLKKTFGSDTLEENLDFIAKALGSKGNTSREVIRNYFLKDFFKDHCKVYQKRPIYWLFDSGKEDGFKALIYMHRYNEDTIGNLRIDYLHRMQRVYESEIARMQDTIENSNNAREVAAATKRKEKLTRQLKETKEYDEKIAHLALARISIDLDDGVKVNYDKVQTGTDSKKLDVLAKI